MMHAFVGDEVFDADLAFRRRRSACGARCRTFRCNLAQLVLDDRQHALLLREDVEQVLDRLEQLVVFALDLVALEAGELVEAEVEDVADLLLAEDVAAVGRARASSRMRMPSCFDDAARPGEREQLAPWLRRGRASRG